LPPRYNICPTTTIDDDRARRESVNKTDRNDARGIAQMIRAGLDRPVHVKTLRSQKLRMKA
jgi:transposase